jgi:TatD DNase family protein
LSDVPARDFALTDTHAHLSIVERQLGSSTISDIERAYALKPGETHSSFILDPGTEPDDFSVRKNQYGDLSFVRLAAGIWPGEKPIKNPIPALEALERAVRDPECAAVGECGLDYHWMHGTKQAQRDLFSAQISLARTYKKPLIVHSRDAASDTLDILKTEGQGVRIILHCFGYDAENAKKFLDAGCWISFAGNITYKKAESLRDAAAIIPLDRLLLETDSPYMTPEPHRGRPCTPLDIRATYELVAKLKRIDLYDLAKTVTSNARFLFY